MKDLLDSRTWATPYAMAGWGSLIGSLGCSIVFFAAYGGTAWWILYYPRPDALITTDQMSFGLFRMCIRGDCIIDMTNRQIIHRFVTDDFGLKQAALYGLPACQWMMSFAVFFIMVLFIVYLGFLAGANTYFAETWLQFVIAILIIASVAQFGVWFRGPQSYLAFGWSYWIAVIAALLYIINGIFMWFVAQAVRKKASLSQVALMRMEASGSRLTLAS